MSSDQTPGRSASGHCQIFTSRHSGKVTLTFPRNLHGQKLVFIPERPDTEPGEQVLSSNTCQTLNFKLTKTNGRMNENASTFSFIRPFVLIHTPKRFSDLTLGQYNPKAGTEAIIGKETYTAPFLSYIYHTSRHAWDNDGNRQDMKYILCPIPAFRPQDGCCATDTPEHTFRMRYTYLPPRNVGKTPRSD